MEFDITDERLAGPGSKRVEWAGRHMPVLASIRERFRKETPLEGHTVASCLHVTAETANLMLALQDGGAEVALCASNPLSTQDDVAAALVEVGIPVYARRGEDVDTYYKHIHAVLDLRPLIVMDDGADLTTVLHTERRDLEILGGTEETTTGVNRLRAMAELGDLRFPVVAVNDSDTKHLFDNHHGTGQSSLDGILRATNVLFAGSTVVVVGYGDCGQGVAARADGLGAKVVVVEIDPIRALSAAMEGYQVMTAREAARVGDIFITVTGNLHVLREEHFAAMKDGAILANAGHFDVEIDIPALERMAENRRDIRQSLDEFVLPDGRRILLVAEGRLVNLAAAEGHPPDVMDMSFSNQALAVEWLALNGADLEASVYRLPKGLDAEVARIKLGHLGAGLEEPTEEQERYLATWLQGT